MVNKEELFELYSLISADKKAFQVRWNHVRGHRGIEGNEMADQLAREGAKNFVAADPDDFKFLTGSDRGDFDDDDDDDSF